MSLNPKTMTLDELHIYWDVTAQAEEESLRMPAYFLSTMLENGTNDPLFEDAMKRMFETRKRLLKVREGIEAEINRLLDEKAKSVKP